MIVMLARDTDRDLTMIVPELPDRDAPASRVRQRKIIHIDMDAFFASVEQRDNPELSPSAVLASGALSPPRATRPGRSGCAPQCRRCRRSVDAQA